MNRREFLVSGSVAGVGVLRIDAAAFGATGDGVSDDAPAIQAALDHVGNSGGGSVSLSPPKIHYRITKGLILPSHVTIEGVAATRYPFNAANKGACALVADFDNPQQWIIDTGTTAQGQRLPHNRILSGALPAGVTYNCGVRDLLLTSKGSIPFGGIRMLGCPGSYIDGVSVDRVGCGVLINHCSGGEYKANIRSLFYGVVAWHEANGNVFQVYCAQSTPWPATVPDDYRMPFMQQMTGHFVDTLKLSTDAHVDRPFGIICGSMTSTSTGNAFDAVVERFAGAIFLYNAYATDFRQCYLEAEARAMAVAVTASRSRFSISALHAYMSRYGALFDFGIEVTARIFASGILDSASFGKPPFDDGSSLLLFEGIDPAKYGAPLQRNIRYVDRVPQWTALALQSGWRTAGEAPAVRLDPWSHRVEWKGSMIGGKAGTFAILPASCRPQRPCRYRVAGGRVVVTPDGGAEVEPDDAEVGLDGIGYSRW